MEALHLVDVYCKQEEFTEGYEYSLSLSPFTNQWLDSACLVVAKEISKYPSEKQTTRLIKILPELKKQDSETDLPASYYALWSSYVYSIIDSSQSKEGYCKVS